MAHVGRQLNPRPAGVRSTTDDAPMRLTALILGTRQTIAGTVPALQAVSIGCPFEPRCDYRVPECARFLPALVEVAPGHWARCPVVNPR